MPKRTALALFLLCGVATAAAVDDEFVPYDDGRLGGCYRTAGGELYNCTRNPRRIDEVVRGDDPAADDPGAAATREEVEALRRELAELKAQQAADEARRAAALERRAQARAQAQAAEQADIDAANAAHQAIESAKDSARLAELQKKTDACRARLEKKGYSVVGAGACKAPDGSYVNCPEC